MNPRALPLALATASVVATALGVASCAVQNTRIGIEAPPYSETSFKPLGDFLVYRCGTLDCHGQPGRNLRIWGANGMRLDPEASANSDFGGPPTTNDEYVATYRSLVGLEPQVMTTVWTGCQGQNGPDGGADYPPPEVCHPELLTFVQKARGTEKHKGGQLICLSPPCPPGIPDPAPYDLQDVCIVSWLEGNVNATACRTAARSHYGLPQDAGAE